MRILLIFIVVCFPNLYSDNVIAGKVGDKSMYWQNAILRTDTLDWNQINAFFRVTNEAKCPQQAKKPYAADSLDFFRIKQPNPMSIAILKDLGYDILMLTQWNALPAQQILVDHRAMPEYYNKQRVMSDLIWDKLERYEIEKPTRIILDYRITFFFGNGNYSLYIGKEDLFNAFPPIMSATETLRLQFYDKSFEEEVLKRKIYDIYIISGKNKKPKEILDEIEKVMDNLKLDLTYKTPEILPL